MIFQRILVPVDFSACSDTGAKAAAVIAVPHRASVALLHVVPEAVAASTAIEPVYVPPGLTERWAAARATHADQRLAELATELRRIAGEGVEVTTTVARGAVVEEILAAAGRGADLVVMGSHGLSGAARLVLGSVAEKVSRGAPCPVLVVHARDGEETADWRRVMVGIDFTAASEAVCRLAAAVAGPGAELDIVHVWSPPFLPTMTVDIEGTADDLGQVVGDERTRVAGQLARFAADLGLVGVKVDTHVGVGSPVAELLARATETQPDLIVLGSHAREGIGQRLLGTVADRMLRHAETPVLLLPREARDPWTRHA